MQRSPLITDGAGQTISAAEKIAEPLIDGSATFLWTGVGAALVIFVLVFVLMARGRAAASARRRNQTADFFQPAGEGAEISFDEHEEPAPSDPLTHGDLGAEADIDDEIIDDAPEPPAPKRKSPFAGLFARRRKSASVDDEPDAHFDTPDDDEAIAMLRSSETGIDVTPAATEHEEIAADEGENLRASLERELAARRAEEKERAANAERMRAEAEREQMELARREEARRREEEERARIRLRAEADEQALRAAAPLHPDDVMARTLSEVEEALHIQSEEIKAETRNILESFARRFDAQLETIANAIEQRAVLHATADEGQPRDDETRVEALVELISRRLADHRDNINAALNALSSRIEEVSAGPEDASALRREIALLRSAMGDRAGPASAPQVQLSDIVRNALPPNAYEFSAVLANNRKADCLVLLPHPPGPIAIDARFPTEAFHTLHQAHNGGTADAESEFRRVALRHIVDIAERLIAPEQTADSALMFIPSEAMYAELHARFPDIIQDSYRARVWIVSPTTLMATLHTIRAVLRDARQRESASFIHAEAQEVLTEVDLLRRRVTALEDSFDKTRHDVRDLVSSTDQVYRRAETITNTGRTLAEESLERGARRIIRTPADDEDVTETMHAHPAAPIKRASAHDHPSDPDDRRPPDPSPDFPLR